MSGIEHNVGCELSTSEDAVGKHVLVGVLVLDLVVVEAAKAP